MKKLFLLACSLVIAAGLQSQSTDSLVAWYPFNGNFIDETGHGHDGIQYHAYPATDRCLEEQKAIEFPWYNGRVQLSNTADLHLASGPFSIVMWIKGAVYNGYYYGGSLVINPLHYYDSLNGFCLGLGEGEISFSVNDSRAVTRTLLWNYAWHMVVAVADTMNLYLYLDGDLEDSVIYSRPLPNSSDIYLASCPQGSTWYYNGLMDDIRIYNRAISKSEVMDLYNEKPFPLEIYSSPGDALVCVNTTFVYEVGASGSPRIYQWLKDGIALPGATDDDLVIPVVSEADTGNYRCVVSNSLGAFICNTGHLSLTYPLNSSILGKTEVITGEIATYSVPKYPDVTYTFLVDGGMKIDSTDNSTMVEWIREGQGYVGLLETVPGVCTHDTLFLPVMVGPSGLDEQHKGLLRIYPNPSSGLINIEIPFNSGSVELTIACLDGRKLLERKIAGTKTALNISSLPVGIYIVKVEGEKGVQVGKFVKE